MQTPNRSAVARALCDAARRLDTLGLVPARDGNLSARLSDDRFLVTRTGVRKRELVPGDLVEVDLDGVARRGDGRASSELGLHLVCYRLRPDVKAVVHAHPPTAIGFASAGLGLTDCLMPEVAVNLGSVPLTPYATPGTPAIEAAIAPSVRDHDAFLLANHGAVTLGTSVDEALDRMETVEHFAKVALVARLLGGARPLPSQALADLEELRRRSGNPRPVTCAPGEDPPFAPPASASPVPAPGLAAASEPGNRALVERVAAAVLGVLAGEPPQSSQR